MKFDGTVEEFLELTDAISQPLTDEDDDVTLSRCLIDQHGLNHAYPVNTPNVINPR